MVPSILPVGYLNELWYRYCKYVIFCVALLPGILPAVWNWKNTCCLSSSFSRYRTSLNIIFPHLYLIYIIHRFLLWNMVLYSMQEPFAFANISSLFQCFWSVPNILIRIQSAGVWILILFLLFSLVTFKISTFFSSFFKFYLPLLHTFTLVFNFKATHEKLLRSQSHKTVESRFFFDFFASWWKDPDRIRIRSVQNFRIRNTGFSQCCGSLSGSGIRIRIGSVFNRTIGSGSVIWIRIRIRIQEGKNDPQK
jgi:hypothetical protein